MLIGLCVALFVIIAICIVLFVKTIKNLYRKNRFLNDKVEKEIAFRNEEAEQIEKLLDEQDTKVKETKGDLKILKSFLKVEIDRVEKRIDENNYNLDLNRDELEKLKEKLEEFFNAIGKELYKLSNRIDENSKKTDKSITKLIDIVYSLAIECKKQKEQIDEYLNDIKSSGEIFNGREDTFEVLQKRLAEIDLEEKEKQENKKIEDVSVQETSEITVSRSKESVEPIEESSVEVQDKSIVVNEPTEEKVDKQDLYAEKIKKALDIDQKKAYDIIRNTNDNLFITGKAGTGKSFLIDIFSRSINKKILLLAPTGTAAVNINGATIHSAFGYQNLEKPLEQLKSRVSLSSEKKEVLKSVDLIIIDEISMVRADTFDKIDRILQLVNNTNKPFGGKQVVVFGDIFQLPPVVKNEEKDFINEYYDNEFFFSSNVYKGANFRFIELKINHRQQNDSRFFDVLNRIREGVATDNDINLLNERTDFDDDLSLVTKIFAKKSKVQDVNEENLRKLPSQEFIYKANVLFNAKNTSSIENSLPIVNELRLKAGAIVMMTRNDKQGRWQNGSLAKITKRTGSEKIEIAINEKPYWLEKEIFEEKEAVYEDGAIRYKTVLKVEQYPIILAYAMTIHKSQGQTFSKIAVDASDCFAPGQVYVALSRCRSLDGLFLLNPLTIEDMLVNSHVKDFYLKQLASQY